MNKEKLLTYLVIALVVLNILFLSLFLIGKGGPPGERGPRPQGGRSGVQKMFDFDDKQMADFEKSRETIMARMDVLQKDLNQLSRDYYLESIKLKSLSQDSLLIEINKINNQIYNAHADHFNDIKKLSDPAQAEKLELFIKELIGKPKGNGPNERKQGPPPR